ncbi:LysR family transcriptional regulator [Cupriavidus respiraculi]|uniref:HTH-type transcriptional regulator PgrR n=1 Tax=Cupriavidus respiraculi TaxID=195930 RepID=A0ABN7Y0G9_9BURK|nr:HTH-type transcriptional regulator PgrR [Cupriavidus respiraculi]
MDNATLSPAPALPSLAHLGAAPGDALASSFATSYAGVVAFLAVVSEGSFARAADRLGIGRSAVSRSVQKLEAQLDARLFMRTTRSTTLTREGELFYENCRPGIDRIAQALDDLRELRHGPPRGHLRVRATTGFGRKVVAPLLFGFQDAYPEISLDFQLDDRPADFTTDRVDVAFRDGRMEDSQVIARQVVPMQALVCASPDYARQHGMPQCVEDIARHRCINLRAASGRVQAWEFKTGGRAVALMPASRQTFNDPDLVLQAVLAGQGIAQLAAYQISDLLRAGRLAQCLAGQAPDDRGHYICYLGRKHLPARIRAFVDHMTEQIRRLDLQIPFA